jgi:hypothetical protein
MMILVKILQVLADRVLLRNHGKLPNPIKLARGRAFLDYIRSPSDKFVITRHFDSYSSYLEMEFLCFSEKVRSMMDILSYCAREGGKGREKSLAATGKFQQEGHVRRYRERTFYYDLRSIWWSALRHNLSPHEWGYKLNHSPSRWCTVGVRISHSPFRHGERQPLQLDSRAPGTTYYHPG